MEVIKKELLAVRDKYGDERRTRIEPLQGEFSAEDLIPDEPMAIFITDQGYVKRLSLDTFAKQRRGGRGIGGMTTRENDFIRHFFVGSTHQDVLFFSDRGVSVSREQLAIIEPLQIFTEPQPAGGHTTGVH